MKNLIIMVLLGVLSISAYGQTLRGRYSFTSQHGEKKIIKFAGDEFTIQEKDQTSERSGSFEVDSKKLELVYVIDTTLRSDYKIETLKTVTTSGNTEIELKENGHPFKGALVGFMQIDSTLPYRFMIDSTGMANILLSKTENLKSMNITAVGYHSINIPIGDLLNKSTRIKATLRIAAMHNEKQKLVYTIKRQTENDIDLVDSEGKGYSLKKMQ